jgi:hypothetical protein
LPLLLRETLQRPREVLSLLLTLESLLSETLLCETLLSETLLSETLLCETLLCETLLSESLLLNESLLVGLEAGFARDALLTCKSLLAETLACETLLPLKTTGLQPLLTETLSLETLLAETLAVVGTTLVDDLVSVDGGLGDVLSHVTLLVLNYRYHTLAVDDGLDFVDEIGLQVLLDDGLTLDDSALCGSMLVIVLLDVMHDVSIDLSMQYRLHLNYSVVTDFLLDDWSSYVSSVGLGRLLLKPTRCIERSRCIEGTRVA